MIRKEIELKSMYSLGSCRALVTDNSVSIKAYGIAGCLKAWLTGRGESLEIGNLVNGSIEKKVDTSGFNGILITQSGRQMFYGRFLSEDEEMPEVKEEAEKACEMHVAEEISDNTCEIAEEKDEPYTDKIFSFNDGYSWRAVTDRSFPSDSLSIRYILSHRSFYNSFLLHGKYFYGKKNEKEAVAIECDIKNEPHPFPNLSGFSVIRDGYIIVCADTASKNFCEYEY